MEVGSLRKTARLVRADASHHLPHPEVRV